MKIGFLLETLSYSYLGPEYLAAVLRNAGYDVAVILDGKVTFVWEDQPDSLEIEGVVEELTAPGFDVVFTSLNAQNVQRHHAILAELKKRQPEVVTCVGGPQATYGYEYVAKLPGFDYLCRGEGEVAILEFLKFLKEEGAPLPSGLYRKGENGLEGEGLGVLVADLDLLPYPDKSDYLASWPPGKQIYFTLSGRGCFNKCTFCNSSTIADKYRGDGFLFMRRRSLDDLMRELVFAKEKLDAEYIWFNDDVFIYNRRYMDEFAARYKAEVGLPFGCATIPNFFHDDTIAALVDAGLACVQIGIQTLDEQFRKEVFNRHETNDEFRRFVRMFVKRGVFVISDEIITPWNDLEGLKEQVREFNEIGPSLINVYNLQYFPDTRIIEYAIRDGLLTEEDRAKLAQGMEKSMVSVDFSASYSHLQGAILLLSLAPFLPAWLIRFLLRDLPLKVVGLIPGQLLLVVRAMTGIFHKGDFHSRRHMRQLFRSIFRIKDRPDPAIIERARELTRMKHTQFPPDALFDGPKKRPLPKKTRQELPIKAVRSA